MTADGVTEHRGSGESICILTTHLLAQYTRGQGMTTAAAEALGDSGSNAFAEMAFSIEKTTVTARSRALKAEYTMELAQDLKSNPRFRR